MRLTEYPRPPGDNGRGIHWSPKQQNHGIHSWPAWENYLRRMRISWVKVVAAPDEDSVKVFRRLAALRIMSVVRYVSKLPSFIGGSQLEHARQLWLECGVPYVERVNEPDSDFEWGRRPPDWHLQAANINIEDAARIQAQGQIPVIAMFNAPPGPNCIQLMLQQPGGREVLSGACVLSIHNYGKGRPLEYPNDRVRMFGDPLSPDEYLFGAEPPGHWSAEDVRKNIWKGYSLDQVNQRRRTNANPEDNIMQNITNFRMFQFWAALWDAEGLPPCPIIGTESGWEVDDLQQEDHGIYPEPTAELHARYLVQQAKFQDGSEPLTLWNPDGSDRKLYCPERYFTSMNWLIAENMMGEGGQWEQGAWVTHWHDQKYDLTGELPVVQRLQETPDRIRQIGPTPSQWAKWTPWNAAWYGCDYDSRIDYIQPRIEILPIEGEGWYLRSFKVQYPDDRQALLFAPGYVFLKAYRNGRQVDDIRFQVDSFTIAAKPAPDWADFKMDAPRPRHTVEVFDGPSFRIRNLGLGIENKSSWDGCTFVVEFEYGTSRANMSWMNDKIDLAIKAHKNGDAVPDEVTPYWNRAKAYDPEFSEPKATIRRPDDLQPGERYHKVIYIGILPGNINNGQHSCFVEYVDRIGVPIRSPIMKMRWGWEGMSDQEFAATSPLPVEKSAGLEFGGSQPLFAGQRGIFPIDPSWHATPFEGSELKSEWVEGVHTAYPGVESGNTRFHTSHYVIYTEDVYEPGQQATYEIFAVADPVQGGQVSGAGPYEDGQTAMLEAIPSLDWHFVGWYEDGEPITLTPALSFTVDRETAFIAKFEQDEEGELSSIPAIETAIVVTVKKSDLQAAIDNEDGDFIALTFEA